MVAKIIEKPALVHVEGLVHRVVMPLRYQAASGIFYTVPVGFETDGASVPRALWSLYPPFGEDYEVSAVLHDYLYSHAELYSGMTRSKADALLLEAMAVEGFRRHGRMVIYLGVRFGGGFAWNRYRKEARESVS